MIALYIKYVCFIFMFVAAEIEEGEECFPALPEDLKHIPLEYQRLSNSDMVEASFKFYQFMNKRRTVRHFSSDPIPIEVIQNIIRTAGIVLYIHRFYLCPYFGYSNLSCTDTYFAPSRAR